MSETDVVGERLEPPHGERSPPLVILWLTLTAIAMLGWISALVWLAWRMANWLLF